MAPKFCCGDNRLEAFWTITVYKFVAETIDKKVLPYNSEDIDFCYFDIRKYIFFLYQIQHCLMKNNC